MDGDDVDEGAGRTTPKPHRDEDENKSTAETSDLQKVTWTYSQYMDALEKEDMVNRTSEETFSCLSGECESV